jgi:hypothetical protein
VKTDDLIAELVSGAAAVRPLPSPWKRALIWLAIALPFVALVVWLKSPRPDLAALMQDPWFVLGQGSAAITAICAAIAAFSLVIPGASPRWIWAPVLPGVVWLSTLGLGCVADWLAQGADGLRIVPEFECFAYISLIGSVPAIAFLQMLRAGAPMAPRATMFLAVLAAAALGNFGLRLFHVQDAALMVVVWQMGSVAILASGAAALGPRLLNWAHVSAPA